MTFGDGEDEDEGEHEEECVWKIMVSCAPSFAKGETTIPACFAMKNKLAKSATDTSMWRRDRIVCERKKLIIIHFTV
jgi:hypothetical protein